MSRYIGILVCLACLIASGTRAAERFCFRVYLKDKGISGCSLERPGEYLSEAAIERRERQGVEVEDSDLPIARAYLDTLSACGGTPVLTSKWMATVVVASGDSAVAERIMRLPMVDSVKWVWKGEAGMPLFEASRDTAMLAPADPPERSLYGFSEKQIKMLGGIKLHKAGFEGKGVRIAVVDAGFRNVDRISVFDSLRLEGTRNFLFPGRSVFEEDDHGTKVLSCLAAYDPGRMIGTAPKASYWLLKSEDVRSEYPIEEDYWAAAVEFADSVGVDIITSSLGYFSFDQKTMEYGKDQLDGRTSLISRAAGMAAKKGILLFCSAGNEGNGDWEKVTFPADAPDVLTVGAVTGRKEHSLFSSKGPTADGRVKPDVVAMGSAACVVDADGCIRFVNGTSFATPILAGLGACLWQALPSLTSREIMDLIRMAGDRRKKPGAEFGYGIPDMYKAYKKGKKKR